MTDTLGLACEHGMLARACEACELEREVASLSAQNATLRAYLGEIFRALAIDDPDPAHWPDEVKRLRERVEWRPIEMAPRDGTEVLLWDGPLAIMEVGHWTAERGWMGDDGLRSTPTHWMPLPEPPKENAP